MERNLRDLKRSEPLNICSIAAVAIGSAVIGGVVSSSAAKSAAKTQATAANTAAQTQLQAAREAAALQLGMFNTIRGDLAPYRDFGSSALPGYSALLGLPSPGAVPTGTAARPASAASGQRDANGLLPDSPYYSPPGYTRGPNDEMVPIPGYQGTGAAPAASAQAPMRAGDANYAQLLKDRPDVLAEYNRILPTVDWNSPWAAEHGFTQGGGPEQFAQWWATQGAGAQDKDYTVPTWTQEQIDSLYPQTSAAPAATTGSDTAAPALDASGIQKYLESLPGYQFTKEQGMQAVTNQQSARGLGGVSGAYGKGLARFVTGLADQTYGAQLDRIAKAAGVGQSAAAQTGQFGSTAASGAAGNITGGGTAAAEGITGAANAGAAGTIGAANAVTSGLNSAAQGLLTNKVVGMYDNSTRSI